MNIEDGDILTDDRNTICKCCGRRMGFMVKTLDQPWGKFYLKFGCIDDPITAPCFYDNEIPCKEKDDCPITANDVRSLAIYYVNFFQNLLTNYHWQTVSFELTQDILLNHILQIILQRKLPYCTVSIPFSHIHIGAEKITGEKTEYTQTHLHCVVLALSRTNLPPNGSPFDFNV